MRKINWKGVVRIPNADLGRSCARCGRAYPRMYERKTKAEVYYEGRVVMTTDVVEAVCRPEICRGALPGDQRFDMLSLLDLVAKQEPEEYRRICSHGVPLNEHCYWCQPH